MRIVITERNHEGKVRARAAVQFEDPDTDGFLCGTTLAGFTLIRQKNGVERWIPPTCGRMLLLRATQTGGRNLWPSALRKALEDYDSAGRTPAAAERQREPRTSALPSLLRRGSLPFKETSNREDFLEGYPTGRLPLKESKSKTENRLGPDGRPLEPWEEWRNGVVWDTSLDRPALRFEG